MEWTLNGNKEIGPFIDVLTNPEEIYKEFIYYQNELGKEFTLEQLLKIYDIHAWALIAKAIYDHPEYTMDQLFKAFNSGQTFKIEGTLTVDNE